MISLVNTYQVLPTCLVLCLAMDIGMNKRSPLSCRAWDLGGGAPGTLWGTCWRICWGVCWKSPAWAPLWDSLTQQVILTHPNVQDTLVESRYHLY